MRFGLVLSSVMALVFSVRAAELSADSAEIVLAEEASDATRIAARELSFFLEKAFGRSVPTVSAPTAGKQSIVLGENAWSRAAGIDPKPLPRDSFVLKTVGDRLFVVGVDDARKDPEQYNYLGSECLWQPQFERGTLDVGPMNECRGETVLPFVVLKDVDGKETTLAGGRGPRTMMSIPLSRLPPGDIPYTFEMRTRLGASVRGFVDGVIKR